MLQGEHSVILSTFIKLPVAIKIFVLSIFEWPLKTDFTVVGIVLRVHPIIYLVVHLSVILYCFFLLGAVVVKALNKK